MKDAWRLTLMKLELPARRAAGLELVEYVVADGTRVDERLERALEGRRSRTPFATAVIAAGRARSGVGTRRGLPRDRDVDGSGEAETSPRFPLFGRDFVRLSDD